MSRQLTSEVPPAPVTVLAADSAPVTLLGLTTAIDRSDELALAFQATEGNQALAAIHDQQPEVAVIDAYLDGLDGCEIARAIRAEQLSTRTLILAEHHTGDLLLRAFTAGATGFLSKRSSVKVFIDGILRIANGGSVLSADVGPALAETLRKRSKHDHFDLTPREREVLRHIAQGENAITIAQSLQIAIPTVKTHIQNIYIKLGVNDRAAAVATAVRRGLLD